MTLDDILNEINKAETIVVMAHENPDGDAIGSCTAMGLALQNMGKKVDILMKDYPANFSYLPGIELIKTETETEIEVYDLAIVLDCPELKRVKAEYIPYFENAKVKVEFDHHTKNGMFGDYNVVDHVAPACAQILVSSFEYLNIDITKEIGICLLTGIITDTGGFRHSNTTAESFEFAAWAIGKGINISKIYKQAMLTKTMAQFEVEKLCMDRMEFFGDGKIAFTYTTKEDDERLGIEPGDHDGVVEIGRSIEGVEVSIFIYEKDKGFKASLRSNDYVNVADICFLFGGGGHVKAAGTNLNMTLEEAKKAVIAETIKHLK